MASDASDIENSCPYIDKAIDQMEEARSIHSELRAWGNKEYQRAEDLEEQLRDLEKEFDNLQSDFEQYKIDHPD